MLFHKFIQFFLSFGPLFQNDDHFVFFLIFGFSFSFFFSQNSIFLILQKLVVLEVNLALWSFEL